MALLLAKLVGKCAHVASELLALLFIGSDVIRLVDIDATIPFLHTPSEETLHHIGSNDSEVAAHPRTAHVVAQTRT